MGRTSADRTVIIGAGIHGISTALALAARGRPSLVLEAGPGPFEGASIRNEGKLHLGFVYALDESETTTRSMVEGSLAFAPLIERWCGEVDWPGIRSEPFGYVVMEKGLAGPDQVERHYASVLARIEKAEPSFGSNYLGVDMGGAFVERHDEVFPGMAAGHSCCWFETPERAARPRAVAALMLEAVAGQPLIEVRAGHRVRRAKRIENGFSLEVESGSGCETLGAETVVNCAWEGRPELDRMILGAQSESNFRVKYSVTVRGGDPGGIRTVTMVQGPFGDVVPWPNGDVYVNWYPTARIHFGDRPLATIEPDRDVAESVHEVIREMFPALGDFRVEEFAPCHILADGRTDINDPESGLHARGGAEFVESAGWWSVRSSKLTTAPLAGERCGAAIAGDGPAF